MRAIRTTTISCGLLNADVKLYSATEEGKEIHFNLCTPDGLPVEQINIEKQEPDDQEWVMEEGERTDRRIVTTYPYERLGRMYHGKEIDPSVITQAEEASLEDEDGNDLQIINVERFIPLKDVPKERVENLYFIGPDQKRSSKSFETFKAALKKKKVAGIAKVVVRKRQMLLAIYESNGAVYALRLRYAAEMRKRDDGVNDDLITDTKPVPAEVALMGELIDGYMVEPSALDEMEDTYVEAKVQIVEDLMAGGEVEKKEKTTKAKKNSNLMAELEASVKAVKTKKRKVKA